MDTSRLRTPSGARLNGGTPKASRSPPWRRQKNLEGQEKFQGVFEFFCCKDPCWLTLCVRAPARRLASRVPQRGFQPPLSRSHRALSACISSRECPPPIGWPRLASHAVSNAACAPRRPAKNHPLTAVDHFRMEGMSSIKDPILAQSSFHSAHLPIEFDALVTHGEPHL
jgi:hypothetical protein